MRKNVCASKFGKIVKGEWCFEQIEDTLWWSSMENLQTKCVTSRNRLESNHILASCEYTGPWIVFVGSKFRFNLIIHCRMCVSKSMCHVWHTVAVLAVWKNHLRLHSLQTMREWWKRQVRFTEILFLFA